MPSPPTTLSSSTEVLAADHPVRPGGKRTIWPIRNPFSGQSQLTPQPLQRRVNRRLGGNSEVLEKVLGGRTGAEAVHADKFAIGPDNRIPAEPDRGFDRDLDRRGADDRATPLRRLRQQQVERGH